MTFPFFHFTFLRRPPAGLCTPHSYCPSGTVASRGACRCFYHRTPIDSILPHTPSIPIHVIRSPVDPPTISAGPTTFSAPHFTLCFKFSHSVVFFCRRRICTTPSQHGPSVQIQAL
ncbi:unnamed protein product [Peniophora sp. CBMAI 1063]|nr:unnamed protein product [Peniophora sp. CBMAI 1063]